MAQLKEGSIIKKPTGDEVIATVNDIPEIPTSLPANGGNADTVGGFTVGVSVPSNAKFTDTNTTYSEITTAEIDLGTASTLRTITGRRVKYILDKVVTMISSLTKSDVGLNNVDNTSDLNKPISTATQTALNSKVDNSRVLTNVPSGAKFTDTITTINNKTGAISKSDIVALGIPAQDTIYTHPSNHPASMITESTTKRFVSDTEKSSWNSKAEISDIPTRVGQLQNDKSYVTQSELGDAGFGDMVKAVYDTNNSGVVDNAEKVNGFTVGANVPANAKFTDTIYTHPTGTNPHGTTKSDVGLSSVLNYGIATQAEAETGTSNVKYMTPLRVKQAIDSSSVYHVGKTDTPNKNLLWINTNL